MSRHAGERDPAGFELDKERHVAAGETSPAKDCDGEEVDASQDHHVDGDEFHSGSSAEPCYR